MHVQVQHTFTAAPSPVGLHYTVIAITHGCWV